MPPIRTVSTTKPIKTERTHEENQERAYIAASRRSDRSLEARIESARRASEIHKKRTGRALRVTEQDVVNEEMYEEEDDDLPAQIRRLQNFAHLQTGSIDFNRRLHAYVSTQMGTRNALMEQGIFLQPYSNQPFFANHYAPPMQQPTMLPPHVFHIPNPAFHQPQQFLNAGLHHMSASMTTPQDMSNYMNQSGTASPMNPPFDQDHVKRMSLPQQQAQPLSPNSVQTSSRPSISSTTSSVSHDTNPTASPRISAMSQAPDAPAMKTGKGYPAMTSPLSDGARSSSFAPFSTCLPPETQQLLVAPPSMAESNSYNQFWFPGACMPVSYSHKPNPFNIQTTSQSMDPALSMAHLDTAVGSPICAGGYMASAGAEPYGYSSSDSLFPERVKSAIITRTSSGGGSSFATPEGADWASFIDSTFDDGNFGAIQR